MMVPRGWGAAVSVVVVFQVLVGGLGRRRR